MITNYEFHHYNVVQCVSCQVIATDREFPVQPRPSLSNKQRVHSYCWQTSSSYIFSLGCDLFGGISAALHCYFCWWSRQKSGWTVCFLIPYSSQRLFTETPASYYFNSCSFSATERRVRFFFSIDIELDALALMPELDGLLWKYFEIGVGAMMLIRYKLV